MVLNVSEITDSTVGAFITIRAKSAIRRISDCNKSIRPLIPQLERLPNVDPPFAQLSFKPWIERINGIRCVDDGWRCRMPRTFDGSDQGDGSANDGSTERRSPCGRISAA